MQNRREINWETLPLVLKVNDVAHVLNTSRAAVYALCHRKDFPLVKIGRNFRVPKDALRRWLEQQAQ